MARPVKSAVEFLPIGTILLQRSAQDGKLCEALQVLGGVSACMTDKEAEAYINQMFAISWERTPKKTKRAAKKEANEKKYSNKVLGGVTFEYCPDCGGVINCRLATGQLIKTWIRKTQPCATTA